MSIRVGKVWTFERPQASTSPLNFCVISYVFVSEHWPLGILCQKWDYHASREHIYCWTQWYFLAIPSQKLWASKSHQYTSMFQSYALCNISNLHKSPTCRTSSLLHEIVMPYKYAYYEFQINRWSPTLLFAISARAYCVCSDMSTMHWTLDPHNVNSPRGCFGEGHIFWLNYLCELFSLDSYGLIT